MNNKGTMENHIKETSQKTEAAKPNHPSHNGKQILQQYRT